MEKSYLEANTYGVGQLITQRKLLRVPEHQRDFAWEKEDVESFFRDITSALKRDDPDYFIGLIVLLGPHEGTWQILDGQQRLATTIMIYSAIRNWLASRNYDADSNQIETEYIGVRHLGGKYNSRLTMNESNRDTFVELVVQKSPDDEIRKRMIGLSKFSSNLMLLEAMLLCRQLVYEFAEESTHKEDDQLTRLFSLSTYLETRVKAVVMDVSSIANAFVIFESMNARGNELSILNLVKNHVFGQAGPQNINQVHQDWNIMTKRIEDKNPDDFLKIFWTSRFGRVQKPQLYNRVKNEYYGQSGALTLAQDLALASEHYIAIDDPQHDIWGHFGPLCSQRMETLILLGSRQTRAPIFSAIDHFDRENMESFLWSLILLTVRYQIVGQRRTGPLEIACARVANLIHIGQIRTDEDFWKEINTIIPSDEEFLNDFLRFSDRKAKRVAYFLAQMELTTRRQEGVETEDLQRIAHCPEDVSLDFVMPKTLDHEWSSLAQSDPEFVEQWLYKLGNRVLMEPGLESAGVVTFPFTQKVTQLYSQSRFLLTKRVTTEILKEGRAGLENRQRILSDLAVATWPLPQHVRQRK
jgi:hypothetical protein